MIRNKPVQSDSDSGLMIAGSIHPVVGCFVADGQPLIGGDDDDDSGGGVPEAGKE